MPGMSEVRAPSADPISEDAAKARAELRADLSADLRLHGLAEMAARFPGEALRVIAAEGVTTLASVNTTLGYCRYNETGEVEYLFVGAPFRRRGVASWLLRRVAQEIGRPLVFREPISPLGRALIGAYVAQTR